MGGAVGRTRWKRATRRRAGLAAAAGALITHCSQYGRMDELIVVVRRARLQLPL